MDFQAYRYLELAEEHAVLNCNAKDYVLSSPAHGSRALTRPKASQLLRIFLSLLGMHSFFGPGHGRVANALYVGAGYGAEQNLLQPVH